MIEQSRLKKNPIPSYFTCTHPVFYQHDQILITEDVVKAAVSNRGNGKEVIELLLDRRGDQIQITEDVVKAAAENGEEVMALLLDRRDDQIRMRRHSCPI